MHLYIFEEQPISCWLKEEIWSCFCLYLVMFLSPSYFDILKKKSWVHHDKLRNTGGGNWLGQHPIAAAAKCIKLMRPRLRRLWLIRSLPSHSHVLCAGWQFFLFVSWATKNLPGKRFPSILPSTWLGVQGANVLKHKSLTFTLHQSGLMEYYYPWLALSVWQLLGVSCSKWKKTPRS